jgi:hypothetical protein
MIRRFPLEWGSVAIDYDNDGRDDLAVSAGRFFRVLGGDRLVDQPEGAQLRDRGEELAQRQFLFHNESNPGR